MATAVEEGVATSAATSVEAEVAIPVEEGVVTSTEAAANAQQARRAQYRLFLRTRPNGVSRSCSKWIPMWHNPAVN